MKKRSILTIAAAVAIIALLAVGTTLAYFTSRDSAANTFTMGSVEIDLKESDGTLDETTNQPIWTDDGLTFDPVMPGDSVTKMAKVIVDETSENCYVRVTAKITVPEGTALTAENIAAITNAVKNAISNAWTVTLESDGTLSCVYNTAAAAGDELTLFTTIVLPGDELKNNAQSQSFSIELNAYAVQEANLSLADINWNSLSF